MNKVNNWGKYGAIAGIVAAILTFLIFLLGDGIIFNFRETKTDPIASTEQGVPSVQEKTMPPGEVEISIPPQNKSTVQAVGIAVARSDISNLSQRSYLLKKAAEADAKRKLAESIKGTLVDAQTVVENAAIMGE